MKIKTLSRSDIALIEKFERENPAEKSVFIYPDQKEINFIFNNPHCMAFGVFYNDLLIGWGGYLTGFKDYSLHEGYFEVNAIYVAKQYRNEGIGKLLLEKVLTELKRNEKWKRIFLTVSPLNKSALIFYLNSGFVIFDFKKNYFGEGEDRIFLSLIKP